MTPKAAWKSPFKPALFRFLKDLKANNNRDWFHENKSRYEELVRDAAFQFIEDFAPHLNKISPHFNAIPKPVGGSLFRIYRDVRFSKDKSPYKTHVGIHFRHKRHKDAHAPGFYLHLEPGGIFMGAGLWRPDSPGLRKIRQHIVDEPTAYKRALRRATNSSLDLGGETLTRPPKGFDPEHALIEEIKRKSFIAVGSLTQKSVLGDDFLKDFTKLAKAGGPLVKFLCEAIDVEY